MIIINESVSWTDFREEFNNLSGSTQDRINQVKSLIDRASKGFKEYPVITQQDLNNKSKNDLYDTLNYLCYKQVQVGDFIKVNGTILYYVYGPQKDLVDVGYLYNIAKGAMTAKNVFGSAGTRDALKNLQYKLDHGSLKSVSILS